MPSVPEGDTLARHTPPLTHGLEHDPTEVDKMDCLRQQLTRADRNNLLHRIQMFFDAMPPSGWKRLAR